MTDLREDHGQQNAKAWLESIEEMIEALDTEDSREREEAEQRIHESALSVMVRAGWYQPGSTPEDGAEEYEILLTTGGPALRIYGQIGKWGDPTTAELQYQDWGTPWTRYPCSEATLLDFARCFYFDE